MADRIQVNRGLKSNLPTLAEGEMGLCTDTKEIYIGTDTGNLKTNKVEVAGDTTFTKDVNGQITGITEPDKTTTITRTNGSVSSIEEIVDGKTITYTFTYDASNNLTITKGVV